MAALHGKQAHIYWDAEGGGGRTVVDNGQSWSLTATHEAAEITSMQDTWKTFTGGFCDWTATVTVLYDSGGNDVALTDLGTSATLELYLVYDAATPSYKMLYGSAFVTQVSPKMDASGIAEVTYEFQGTPGTTLAWYSGAALKTY